MPYGYRQAYNVRARGENVEVSAVHPSPVPLQVHTTRYVSRPGLVWMYMVPGRTNSQTNPYAHLARYGTVRAGREAPPWGSMQIVALPPCAIEPLELHTFYIPGELIVFRSIMIY